MGRSPGTARVQPPTRSPAGKRRMRRASNRRSDTIGGDFCKYFFKFLILNILNSKIIDLPPSMRVQFILGEDADQPGLLSHPIFSEMEEFNCELASEGEWKETAR